MARHIFIKIRTTAEERDAYKAAASARNTDLSGLIRAHLKRLVRRADAKQEEGAE